LNRKARFVPSADSSAQIRPTPTARETPVTARRPAERSSGPRALPPTGGPAHASQGTPYCVRVANCRAASSARPGVSRSRRACARSVASQQTYAAAVRACSRRWVCVPVARTRPSSSTPTRDQLSAHPSAELCRPLGGPSPPPCCVSRPCTGRRQLACRCAPVRHPGEAGSAARAPHDDLFDSPVRLGDAVDSEDRRACQRAPRHAELAPSEQRRHADGVDRRRQPRARRRRAQHQRGARKSRQRTPPGVSPSASLAVTGPGRGSRTPTNYRSRDLGPSAAWQVAPLTLTAATPRHPAQARAAP
jgi:hypothetical protein